MLTDVRIISSWRAYLFRGDDIRLSMLTTPQVMEALDTAFNAEELSIQTPPSLFRRHRLTNPPGLVLSHGSWVGPDEEGVPVRAIHASADQIVISIAGPSKYIDLIYDRLVTVVNQIPAPDGGSIIGHPVETKDRSVVSFRLQGLTELLRPPALMSAVKTVSGLKGDLVTAVRFVPWPGSEDYDVDPTLRHREFALEPLSGWPPELGAFRSIAPLPSDEHLSYLELLSQHIREDRS